MFYIIRRKIHIMLVHLLKHPLFFLTALFRTLKLREIESFHLDKRTIFMLLKLKILRRAHIIFTQRYEHIMQQPVFPFTLLYENSFNVLFT